MDTDIIHAHLDLAYQIRLLVLALARLASEIERPVYEYSKELRMKVEGGLHEQQPV